MAGTPKEAVVSCIPLDKASGFLWKTPTKLIIQHSCVNVRPADVLSRQVFAFLPPSLADYFWSGWQYLKACKYMKRWCEPGSNTTQCLRGPTKAQWYTDKHGTFSTPTQTKALFFYSAVINLSCSHGSQSKTLKGGALPIYWSTFILCYLSPIHLPVIPDKIHLILQSKPQALHGHPPSIHARHDKACPCDNSLLTLLFRMVSVTLTDQSLYLRMIASQGHQRRTSRLFFFFFLLKLATQIVRKALPKTSLTGKFWCGSDRVQKRNLKWMNPSLMYLPKCSPQFFH